MTKLFGPAVALAALALIAGCASVPPKAPPVRWIGGAPTHLAEDQRVCREESANLDINQAAGYTDSRYGVASAMARSIGTDNPLTDQTKRVRDATFLACMNDKGWKVADQPLAGADH